MMIYFQETNTELHRLLTGPSTAQFHYTATYTDINLASDFKCKTTKTLTPKKHLDYQKVAVWKIPLPQIKLNNFKKSVV